MTALDSQIDLVSHLANTTYRRGYQAGALSRAKSVVSGWSFKGELVLLWSCIALIASVSMYDVYWSFKTQDVLVEFEKNPIGTWLINMDGGDIALFMTVKMMGTMAVILAIPAIYFARRTWGLIVCVSLAIFQLLLFGFLNYGHLWC